LTVAVALLFSPTNSLAYDINDKFSIGGVMAGGGRPRARRHGR
jgi:hypothetical protein